MFIFHLKSLKGRIREKRKTDSHACLLMFSSLKSQHDSSLRPGYFRDPVTKKIKVAQNRMKWMVYNNFSRKSTQTHELKIKAGFCKNFVHVPT